MTTVVLLALASTTCAAISTVLKHLSANQPVKPILGGHVPQVLDRMIANPLFLAALAVDAAAVAFQVFALRYGDLSTVQPILTLALVISLGLDHAVSRTRITRGEMVWAATLVAGLVLFLVSSGATDPKRGVELGDRTAGLVLGGLALVIWLVALLATRKAKVTVRARVQAAGVAGIYAATAGLIKSSTRVMDNLGLDVLLGSWQLWTLLVLAGIGLVLNQHVFSLAPLHVTLPVIASLDPLFSVVIGRVVFNEHLLATPFAVLVETIGLGMLLLGVVRLSKSRTHDTISVTAGGDQPLPPSPRG
ncbi:hypothetical protein BJY21_002452 [Kineosphaera limosa]|uniref:Uncharacterized protein n=1 Tax=Kineosphaera limosa NBRC 100340 TaxID=1184609 RepID=K6XAU3_9MICO|nr:DMT family transporter [Kineosphaera limosa]NYE01268.1 hypothetical protein [Kineosphaera limosa]GAB95934.1 hypothetical protein KILIM_029_00440 [Kineosphaera limosa NBRC 100340]